MENGIPAGNWENKYQSNNPIKKYLMNSFMGSIKQLVPPMSAEISTVCECGCGEGEVTRYVYEPLNNVQIKAFDFS